MSFAHSGELASRTPPASLCQSTRGQEPLGEGEPNALRAVAITGTREAGETGEYPSAAESSAAATLRLCSAAARCVELGVGHKVAAIAFEKPMAQDLAEARAIRDVANRHGIRLVVSHQQKYGPHWQKVKAIVDSGDIGKIEKIHATARSWLSQLGTHLIDYMIWFNGGTRIHWVDGLSHGTAMLADSHPSPDYTFGQVKFANGVRGIIECGAQSPHFIPGDGAFRSQAFWFDNSVTIHGTHGYARVITGGGWRALTKSSKGQVLSGEGTFNPSYEQPLYLRDLADWLDDPSRVHPCNGDVSYHGFEASMALYLSTIERKRIDLPLTALPSGSLIERLRTVLPSSAEYVVQ